LDKRENILRNVPVLQAIIKLAIPSIAGMIVMAVYNMADTYFVSISQDGMLGTAAVSLMMPVLMLGQAIAMLFAAGGSATVSRLMGEGRLEDAQKTTAQTLTIITISGIALMIAGLIWGRPLLLAFGASDDTIGLALDYANILFVFAPIQLLNMGLNNLLRSEGSAVRSMLGLMVGAFLNIGLDPLFIFTFNMGVFGAAFATALSQAVAFAVLLANYLRKKTVVPLKMKFWKPEWKVLKRIIRIGLSTFASQILVSAAFALVNIFAAPFGDEAIASFGIVNRVQFIGFAIIFGLAMGYQPVAGYNYGAKLFDRLKTVIRYGIFLMLITGGALAAIFNIFAPGIVAAFTDSAYVMDLGSQAMRMNTVVFPFVGFTVLMVMTCQSLNLPGSALILSVGRQGVVMIPVIIILAGMMGLQGIVLTPVVSELIAVVISILIAAFIFRMLAREHAAYEQKQEPRGSGTVPAQAE
jgi:putative MATE family efflux protein